MQAQRHWYFAISVCVCVFDIVPSADRYRMSSMVRSIWQLLRYPRRYNNSPSYCNACMHGKMSIQHHNVATPHIFILSMYMYTSMLLLLLRCLMTGTVFDCLIATAYAKTKQKYKIKSTILCVESHSAGMNLIVNVVVVFVLWTGLWTE